MLSINKTFFSPNYDNRNKCINTIVLHYTGMQDGDSAREKLCDKDSKVSSHYLVYEDGTIYNLVSEEKRAWHAGISFWRGDNDINSCSIGIEIVNTGHEFGLQEFPIVQMESVTNLIKDICSRHNIDTRNIIGHSDVAPLRKKDPGELFNWKMLYHHSIGIWHDDAIEDIERNFDINYDNLQNRLSKLGMIDSTNQEELSLIITAFKRHFDQECFFKYPDKVSIWDTKSDTILNNLLNKYYRV